MPLSSTDRSELDEDTALERFAIDGTVPPHANVGSTQSIDLRGKAPDQPKQIALGFNVNMSQGAVEAALARVKPFVFGGANKVLDLMIELAFDTAGLAPATGRRWTFAEKVTHARSFEGDLPPLTDRAPEVWERLLVSYVNLEEVRHSLAHRRAHMDPSTGDLVGHDRGGSSLRPVTVTEQEQFARLALEAADAVIGDALPIRLHNQLAWRANQLQGLHGRPPIADTAEPVPLVNVQLDLVPLDDGRWRLTADDILAELRKTFQAANRFDADCHATVNDVERVFVCRLEEQSGVIDFEPGSPPPGIWERR